MGRAAVEHRPHAASARMAACAFLLKQNKTALGEPATGSLDADDKLCDKNTLEKVGVLRYMFCC